MREGLDPLPPLYTAEDAYNNFLEILEFARNNRERVILLRGNHDEFLSDENRECCRHDYYNIERNRKLFKDNEDLFQFAYREGDYLFTHAGVCTGWLLQNNLTHINEDNIVDYLNSNPQTLWQIGDSRGGFHDWGSPLWCCWLGDWYYGDCRNPFNLKQVFGHTRLEKGIFASDEEKNIYMMEKSYVNLTAGWAMSANMKKKKKSLQTLMFPQK